MPSNKAAYLNGTGVRPLAIEEAPYTSPPPNYITVKNHALAINPADPHVQDLGLPFIKEFPYVLGCDVAGTVEEVGAEVTHFSAGDRVIAVSAAVGSSIDEAGRPSIHIIKGGGGFQLYSVVEAEKVAKLPENVSFEDGSVLPLGTLGAASSLYRSESLGLEYPSSDPKDQGTYLLVWGGSSSVGSCAVQLARNSGYRVVTTCSAHNIEYCEALGAERAFDHKSASVVDDIVEYLSGKKLAGTLDAISRGGTLEPCVKIAQRSAGVKKIASLAFGSKPDQPEGIEIIVAMGYLSGKDKLKKIFVDFLPAALESGRFKAKPEPLIVGKGLEKAQEAIDTYKAGVSARKVVVTL